jgi:ATP-dependent DNA helicase RecG
LPGGGTKSGMIGGTESGTIGGTKGGSISSDERTEGEFILTDRQKEVLALIKNKPSIGYREVGEILGINQSAAQKHFEALKEKGAIEREGTAKGGYWKVNI